MFRIFFNLTSIGKMFDIIMYYVERKKNIVKSECVGRGDDKIIYNFMNFTKNNF